MISNVLAVTRAEQVLCQGFISMRDRLTRNNTRERVLESRVECARGARIAFQIQPLDGGGGGAASAAP